MNKQYFTLNELYYSDTAIAKNIDNTPNEEVKKRLNKVIEFINPLRESWGSPIKTTSGYRCPTLNACVGGSSTSAHMLGWAVDMQNTQGSFDKFKKFVADYLKDKKFDQCIIESSNKGIVKWIHLGLYNNKGQQRNMIFNINV